MSEERKYHGKPLTDVGKNYHPKKINLEEFIADLISSTKPFAENMKHLRYHEKKMFIEEWYTMFAAWNEVGT